VVRGPSGPSSLEAAPHCAACGRCTEDTVILDAFSVAARGGGRRLAPPMPLCETCRRNVIAKRGFLPTWCAACEDWRPFGHDHDAVVEVPASEVTPHAA
jgi:hypothetical protein